MFTKTLIGLLFSHSTLVNALWPLPKSLSVGTTPIRLASDFTIISTSLSVTPQDLFNAIEDTKSYLANDKLERLVVGRSAADSASIKGSRTIPSLQLSLTGGGQVRTLSTEATVDIGSRKEAYTLTIPSDGSAATLTADTTLGLFRGLTTFSQLWYQSGDDRYTLDAPIKIDDSPAYPYRGFMLDTARNFFPVEDIKRTLDAMSWVKLSTFHWHIVDAQSFPLEVNGFPELYQNGAYSSSEVYSEADVQDIVTYAAAHGIDVLVEVDVPGHSAAISTAHPEFIACAYATPWADYSAEAPAGQIRVTNDNAVNFTASMLSKIARTLPSTLFSTGGDEVNTKCYQDDSQTQSDLQSSGRTIEQALSDFVQSIHGPLISDGKTLVVWEEMVLDHNVTLNKNTIALVWQSSQNAQKVAAKGFRIIHAPSDYFYLDCGAGEWIGNTPTATSWCDPFKSWQKAYTFDPLNGLSGDQANLVLGGEQLLWTEQSGPENLDSIVWPRAASSAEVFWTGSAHPRDITSAMPRIHDLRYRMVQRGVKAIALQPKFCALRPGVCEA